ncbi:MAG TPA: flagellin [Thermodesulfobacteriota bacterium]|nr:flagellin [Thermodesulfobacteriota bacterium]
MAINDISLTQGMRSNLVSLQQTVSLLNRTQQRLSTGKKVNSALDDPISFFASQSELQRASDLSNRKNGMSEGVQTVQASNTGITGITNLIGAAQGLATAAGTAGTTEAASLATQFNSMLTQIDHLAQDSGYQGINLLNGDNLTVKFNEDGSNSLTINGFSATSTGLNISQAAGSWATSSNINTSLTQLSTALDTLRTNTSTLSSNLSVITTRQDFTTSMINVLQTGSDNLTLADTNEEGANMLMLQTRQALGTTALSLSAQAAQSVLRLF